MSQAKLNLMLQKRIDASNSEHYKHERSSQDEGMRGDEEYSDVDQESHISYADYAAELQDIVAGLREKNAALQSEITEKKHEIEKKNLETENKLKQKDDLISEMRKEGIHEINNIKIKYNDMLREAETKYTNMMKEAENNFNNMKNEADNKINNMKNEIQLTHAALHVSESNLNELKAELTKLQQAHEKAKESLQSTLESKMSADAEHNKKISDIKTAAETEYARVQARLSQAQEKVGDLDNRLKEANEKLSTAESSLNDHAQKHTEKMEKDLNQAKADADASRTALQEEKSKGQDPWTDNQIKALGSIAVLGTALFGAHRHRGRRRKKYSYSNSNSNSRSSS